VDRTDRVIDRRHWLRLAAGASGWLAPLAARAATDPGRRRACILLWMAGGPSQLDTLDPKPGHANGGPFAAIETAAPGVRIGEHLPRVAARMKDIALVRSMATKEGDHGRATDHLRTGYRPQGPIQFPTFGALVARERQRPENDLPGYVSIGPGGVGGAALSPGFLGPRYAPLVVAGESLRVEDLDRPGSVTATRAAERLSLMRDLQDGFTTARPGPAIEGHRSAYERAVRLMGESAARAFRIDDEPEKLRDAYGRNRFGRGCLLARRLVERGVPFVEVTLGGWDTHDNNFAQVKSLCGTLDAGWSTLLSDLADRGLLDSTLVVWMGEFGRTPQINPRNGRDHYPNAWSVALGGGGIKGGQAVGRTDAGGVAVTERPVKVPDLLATVCLALGLDPAKQNLSNVNRPIRLVDQPNEPLRQVLA
jgi:hypothetical protein